MPRAAGLVLRLAHPDQPLCDRAAVAHILSNLGWMALYQGDLPAARALQEESLATRRALDERREIAVSLTALGRVAFAAGESAAARALYLESLPLHHELGNQWGVALALEGLVAVLAGEQPALAVRLAGAAAAVRAVIGRTMPPVERTGYEQVLAGLRASLGEGAFAAAWAAGQALSPDRMVAEALALADAPPAAGQ